jgi:hypothetical protein
VCSFPSVEVLMYVGSCHLLQLCIISSRSVNGCGSLVEWVKPKSFAENLSKCHFFLVTRPRRICLGSDIDFDSERLATSQLSRGLASQCFGVLFTFGFVYCFSNTIVVTVPHRNSPFCHDFYHQM